MFNTIDSRSLDTMYWPFLSWPYLLPFFLFLGGLTGDLPPIAAAAGTVSVAIVGAVALAACNGGGGGTRSACTVDPPGPGERAAVGNNGGTGEGTWSRVTLPSPAQ